MLFLWSFFLVGFISLTLTGFIFRSTFLLVFYNTFSTLNFSQKLYALFWGVKFDAVPAVYVSAIFTLIYYLFLRFICRKSTIRFVWMYAVVITIFAIISSADIIYFADSGRHLGYEISDIRIDTSSLLQTAWMQDKALLLISTLIIVMVSMISYYSFRRLTSTLATKKEEKFYLEFTLVLIFLLSMIIGRGGIFRPIPLSPADVFEIGSTDQAMIAVNPPFKVFKEFSKRNTENNLVKKLLPISSASTTKYIYLLYPHHQKHVGLYHLKKYNIVVIMLESWPAALMKSYGYDKNTTPYFDALRKKTWSSDGMIANGHRTSEGLFATFCSYQNPLGHSVANTTLEYNKYACLPAVLSQAGWNTAFYEGTNKNTSGVGELAHAIGFQETYGKQDIKNTIQPQYPQNEWGYQDPDEYSFILKKMRQTPQPFLVGINTTTTHSEEIPHLIKAKFGTETEMGRILSTLYFSDSALHDFLKVYQEQHWKYPTLFLIEADHVGRLSNLSPSKQYFIPFLMYATDHSIPAQHEHRMVSQRDIAPTVMTVLHGYIPWFTGKSMLIRNSPVFADFYDNGLLGWYVGPSLVVTDINSNKHYCYFWEHNMDLKVSHLCAARDLQLINQSLAFTEHSQALLFQGQTKKFFRLFGNNSPPRQ